MTSGLLPCFFCLGKSYTIPQPKPAYSYEKCCFPVVTNTFWYTDGSILPPKSYSAPCFSNSETRVAVCLPHFPARNFDFQPHGDVISHWATRKYHFPSPKKRGICVKLVAWTLSFTIRWLSQHVQLGEWMWCLQDARSNQLGYFVIVLRFFTITGKHVGISVNLSLF